MFKVMNSRKYINETKRVITTIITDQNGKEFMGQAWCSKDDTFDIEFGSKLSYLRAKRKMLKSQNKANKEWYERQTKMFKEWDKAQRDEIDTIDYITAKINAAIDTMLDNQ